MIGNDDGDRGTLDRTGWCRYCIRHGKYSFFQSQLKEKREPSTRNHCVKYTASTTEQLKHIRQPNLTPPITTVAAALSYKSRLQPLSPTTTFLMTLYLHPDITPSTITEAAAAGITGVKVYPAGVTTNSAAGVLDLAQYYPVFAAMQEHDMVLNLHGEAVSTPATAFAQQNDSKDAAITVLNAEQAFLPTLKDLHARFPRLRIVLEHCTTTEALQAVRECGSTVAATITAHHMWLTVDDWCGDAYSFCKPVAKTPEDRVALCRAVVEECSGNKFFFGSDSAPHPIHSKKGTSKTAAGCFTQPWATQLVIGALEEAVAKGWIKESEITEETLNKFLSRCGRSFYRLNQSDAQASKSIVLEKKRQVIPSRVGSADGTIEIVPFRSEEHVWSTEWK